MPHQDLDETKVSSREDSTMNKEQVYGKIRDWEMDAGESFIDYFESNIKPIPFMFWAYGMGYVETKSFNQWEKEYSSNQHEARCANYYICGNKPYSISTHDEWGKGLKILSEFIAGSDTYIDKLEKFLVRFAEEGY